MAEEKLSDEVGDEVDCHVGDQWIVGRGRSLLADRVCGTWAQVVQKLQQVAAGRCVACLGGPWLWRCVPRCLVCSSAGTNSLFGGHVWGHFPVKWSGLPQ